MFDGASEQGVRGDSDVINGVSLDDVLYHYFARYIIIEGYLASGE